MLREALRRWWIAPAVCVPALLALGGAGVGFSDAGFSARSANPANSFQAASSFCAGTRTVVASADAWVSGESKTSNFGTDLNIWSRAGAETSRTLVKFALPSTGTCTVSSATLRLYAGSVTSTDGAVRTLQAFQVGAAWAETTVTWNTQPATTGTAATTTSAAGWRSWDVGTQVQAMYSGANNGFLVRDSSETGGAQRWFSRFDSRENTNKPQLVITLTASP